MDRSRLFPALLARCVRDQIVRRWVRHWRKLVFISAMTLAVPILTLAICWHLFPFPWDKLKPQSVGVQVTDRSGRLMLERVAADDQRRHPVSLEQISPWLLQAVIAVEDERFESHGGVDLFAVVRAVGQNLWAGRKVSGASTITMQLCKMIDERPRTWNAKLLEGLRALQLERRRTKSQILTEYLNLIPCGGNLRGVEAAAQAYFGKSAAQLSLAESALLAGLPQSPNRYAPDRHPEAALNRRETVLRRMWILGQITSDQLDDALNEPLAVQSRLLKPPKASHAAWMALTERPTGGQTTIDLDLQREIESSVRSHVESLPTETDISVVVLDVTSREILALVGSANEQDPRDGQVNGVLARRSPGSTLKPFLYAAAFESRRLSPKSMVDDIPIERAGWSPENFDRTYRGSICAADALRQSLNVPAITITEGLGLPRCLGLLESIGLKLPADAESRGGLAVATGGLEVTLLSLTNAYATLAREGLHSEPQLFLGPVSTMDGVSKTDTQRSVKVLDANVCRAITSILSTEHRCPRGWESIPENERAWFAWKTGTSSGRRDAWAIGHNGRFAIGVWVGHFHGAGHREFVGRDAAEPLLSQLFSLNRLRVEASSPSYDNWNVDRPLPRPREVTEGLAIRSPRNDASFIALNGTTVIHPVATTQEKVTWFHNGRVLSHHEADRLVVPPGTHELRAVAASGKSSVVQFTVK